MFKLDFTQDKLPKRLFLLKNFARDRIFQISLNLIIATHQLSHDLKMTTSSLSFKLVWSSLVSLHKIVFQIRWRNPLQKRRSSNSHDFNYISEDISSLQISLNLAGVSYLFWFQLSISASVTLCSKRLFIWGQESERSGSIRPRWDLTSAQVSSHESGMIFLHVYNFCRDVPPRQDLILFGHGVFLWLLWEKVQFIL